MNAKDYLGRAYKLDQAVDAKLGLVATLRNLATKCTTYIDGMPHSATDSKSMMSDTVDKVVDLEREINETIDEMVDTKREILKTISQVPSMEHQILLTKRYLCFDSWEDIASSMEYSLRHIYNLHGAALHSVDVILREKKNKSLH